MRPKGGGSMPASEMSLGETERTIVGCIVTAREQTTDERIVLHRSGTPSDALRAICDELDSKEGDWKVLTYATPQTIFRDLQGTRADLTQDTLWFPERRVLEIIGRYDMLDPSLMVGDTYGRNWRQDAKRKRAEA